MSQKNKKNILLVSPNPHFAGGIAKWGKHILKYYDMHGANSCCLYFLNATPFPPRAKKTLAFRLYSGIVNYLQVVIDYIKKIKLNDYDLIHITTSASISLIKDLIMLRIARKKGITSAIHFHFGRIPELYTKNNWEWKLISRVITKADKAIVIDESSFKTLLNAGFKNIYNLPNPLSPEVVELIDKSVDIEVKPRTITFVGQMLPTKGIFELIEVCSQIKNVKLNMYGLLPEDIKREILKRVDKSSSQWLNLVGEVDYNTIPKRMKESELFVLPTYTEGFPNVILESMACGCPIIASAVGAIPEMLNIDSDEPCGICVTPKDKVELKEKIEYLLDNPTIAKTLGSRARKRVVAEYSMDSVWNKLLDIWNIN
ncbi:MAG: glycosyltransferase family 4 protein [Bacteroidales bacterium]